MNIPLEKISEYIERIYASVLKPEEMVSILDCLRGELDAPFASLQLENTQNHELGLAHLINYDDCAIAEYAEHFIHCDPWTNNMIVHDGMNNPFKAGHKMVSDKHYRESEFYQDWGRRFGVRHAIGSGFTTGGHQVLKIAFQRHCDHQPFEQNAENLLNLLYPHFAQWVQLSKLFEENEEANRTGALDYFERPVWLLDRYCDLVYQNRHAQQWHASGDLLRISKGKLRANSYEQQKYLEQKIGYLCLPEQLKGAQTVRLSNTSQCHVFWLLPLYFEGRRMVMLIGPKPQKKVSDIERSFSLTQRQAQVAHGLASGHNVEQIARELNISLNTVKNQLASCFTRLQVQNQSQLVEVILQDSSWG